VTLCWESHVAAAGWHGMARHGFFAIKQLSNLRGGVEGVGQGARGAGGVDRHRRGGAASLTGDGIGPGAVGLKVSPTPQTDPTEGNRSARSEPAVERGWPTRHACQVLSAGPLLVCDTEDPMPFIPCISPPVAEPIAVASSGLARRFVGSSAFVRSRGDRSLASCIGITDEQQGCRD
jgi:hypothetical protein